MSTKDETRGPAPDLSPEELEAQQGEELPDRTAMSIVDPVDGGPWHTLPVEPPAVDLPIHRT